MDAIGRQIGYQDDLWAVGLGKMGFFPDPGIRI